MNGGVPNKGLNEQLRDILNELASNSNLSGNSNCIQYIISLLQAGADPNTKGQDGKTPLDYLNEGLRDILNWLESNSNSLGDYNYIQYIMPLLQIGANPNVQNQDGKTLLHYVAERNDTNDIGVLLKAGADPNVQDHSGKTPFEYVTEPNCLKVIEGLGCSSNDKTTCTKLSDSDPDKDQGYYSDDSRKNEGYSSGDDNKTVPTKDKGNLTNDSSNYPNKHNDDQTLRNDPGHSSGDDNKIISTEPSDCDRKDEGSSCSSNDDYLPKKSLLMNSKIPLTKNEETLIGEFCKEMKDVKKEKDQKSALRFIQHITGKYLRKGIRLNSRFSDYGKTVMTLVFEEVIDVTLKEGLSPINRTDHSDFNIEELSNKSKKIMNKIIYSLLSKGGKVERSLFFAGELGHVTYDSNYANYLFDKCKEIENDLKNVAYESTVNKNKQTQKDELEVEIDNKCFYIKYPQDSIIEPVKILNDKKAKELKLKVGIIQIGESIVRVESVNGKRNYTDILQGSIEMSFTTGVEEISICLQKDGNKIKVEIDEENKAKFNKLKDKSSLGKNCLLEGESVAEVIGKDFKMSDSVSTESIEATKDNPSTDLTQVRLQQKEIAIALQG